MVYTRRGMTHATGAGGYEVAASNKGGDPCVQNKKGFCFLQNPFVIKSATTYSPTISSTIGADGFNFSVRNGKRWSPAAIVTLRF